MKISRHDSLDSIHIKPNLIQTVSQVFQFLRKRGSKDQKCENFHELKILKNFFPSSQSVRTRTNKSKVLTFYGQSWTFGHSVGRTILASGVENSKRKESNLGTI